MRHRRNRDDGTSSGFKLPYLLSNIFTAKTNSAIFWLELVVTSTIMFLVDAFPLE